MASMAARAANGRPCTPPWPKSPSTTLRWRCAATIRRRWNSTLRIAGSPSFSVRSASPSLARYSYAKPTSTSPLRAAATSLSLVTRPSCKARRAARSATSSRRDEDAAVTRAAVSSETSAVTCRCRVRRSSSHRLRRCRRRSPPSLARVGRPHLRRPWMQSGDRRRSRRDRAQAGGRRDHVVGDVVDLERAGIDVAQDEVGPARATDRSDARELPLQADRAEEGRAGKLVVVDVVHLQPAGFNVAQQEMGFAGTPAEVAAARELPLQPHGADEGGVGDGVVGDVVDLQSAVLELRRSMSLSPRLLKLPTPENCQSSPTFPTKLAPVI